jgi:Enoyl-(Acyl carrier protein) reductase
MRTNLSESELALAFMQPAIQVTNNPLVVDTGQERVPVDTGFGEKIGPSFGSFPGLEANLRRGRDPAREHRSGVISHGESIARLVAAIPMGRMGEPDEVAKAALFPASVDSSFVHGHQTVRQGWTRSSLIS